MQEMDTLFRRVDVLLAPATMGQKTLIGNMTGHQCLTIRAGFTETRTREMPAYLDAEIKEKEGSVHTVPSPSPSWRHCSMRRQHSPSAICSRQDWRSHIVGRTCREPAWFLPGRFVSNMGRRPRRRPRKLRNYLHGDCPHPS